MNEMTPKSMSRTFLVFVLFFLTRLALGQHQAKFSLPTSHLRKKRRAAKISSNKKPVTGSKSLEQKNQPPEENMASIPQPSLFSWHQIEAGSDLDRLWLVLSVMPDEQFVCLLEKRRGRGRNDYPIRPCWNALMAGIVFQHESAAAVLRELRRNAELRQLCGFDPLLGGDAVPTDDAFGRFLNLVMGYRKHLLKMFHTLIDELKKALPDLGAKLSVDSKGIRSHGRPVRDEEKQKEPDRRRDTDADPRGEDVQRRAQ